MKKISFLTFAAGVLILASCQQDTETFDDATLAEMDLSTEVTAEASLEEVDLIAEAGMETLAEAAGGRMGRDEIIECAVVEKDTVNKVITIDFGDGCEGPHGTIRKGKIIITYSQRRYEPGAFREIVFEDFFIDSVQVTGTRRIENTTDSTSTLEFTITSSGSLIFPDGTVSTHEGEHVRTWYRTDDPQEDYATLTGTANGENRNGDSYSVTIIEELVFKRRCRRGRILAPVSGVIEMTIGDKVAVIDFGDGTCDNLAIVTVDGESKEIQIYPRGFRRLN